MLWSDYDSSEDKNEASVDPDLPAQFVDVCASGTRTGSFQVRPFDKRSVNAAREAVNGKPVDDRSKRCVRRDGNLPGIVLVGTFRYDYGCYIEGAFITKRYLTARDNGLSKAVLHELGWTTANAEQRGALALAWTVKGLMGFVEVLYKKPENFADHPFQAPKAETTAKGEAVVRLWVRLPLRRERGQSYQFRQFRFSSDGEMTKYTQVEDFPKAKTASDPNF